MSQRLLIAVGDPDLAGAAAALASESDELEVVGTLDGVARRTAHPPRRADHCHLDPIAHRARLRTLRATAP